MMKRIDPDVWLVGKTIKKVDSTSVNCNVIFFTDDTAVYLEAEPFGHGIHGPCWYEIDPTKPIHEQ